MNQESITKGLTTPVSVIITFAHLGFHIFDLSAEMVEDETYFSSEYIENNSTTLLSWNKTKMIRPGEDYL